jgi:TRAP-type C4-dicarboxylate transport system substrate-binding protein
MRHVWKLVALAVVGLVSSTATAQDKPIELRFSSWVGVGHGHHTGVMAPWARMIEEQSGGRLKVTIYPGGTLGKPADHFDLVKNGIADMGFAAPGYTPGRFPLITVTELPQWPRSCFLHARALPLQLGSKLYPHGITAIHPHGAIRRDERSEP